MKDSSHFNSHYLSLYLDYTPEEGNESEFERAQPAALRSPTSLHLPARGYLLLHLPRLSSKPVPPCAWEGLEKHGSARAHCLMLTACAAVGGVRGHLPGSL